MSGAKHWDDFLGVNAPVYLLARGPSCASAYEGALLFHEVAKSPAVSMAVGSFRHGPVEVVDQHFRGIVFAPQGKTKDLNLSLANDLAKFGGQILIIQPSAEAGSHEDYCLTPKVPESLAPIFEIVPVQVAALRMAELRGIRPGSFRYAPQVATDEAEFGPLENSNG
jgi:glucosamine--fructose-6-phosphate aminotransferase (isomerizing)